MRQLIRSRMRRHRLPRLGAGQDRNVQVPALGPMFPLQTETHIRIPCSNANDDPLLAVRAADEAEVGKKL